MIANWGDSVLDDECIPDRAELDYKAWNRLAAFATGMQTESKTES